MSIPALTGAAGSAALRGMAAQQSTLAEAISRLSSGYRITSAAGDAAGLAISESLRSRIGGVQTASRNVQDALNLSRTADGALTETHALLQNLRCLAVRGAGNAHGQTTRDAIATEMRHLLDGLDDIARGTRWGSMNLLDGTFRATFHIGAEPQEFLVVDLSRRVDAEGLGLGALRDLLGGGSATADGAAAGTATGAAAGFAPMMTTAPSPGTAARTLAGLDDAGWDAILGSTSGRRFTITSATGASANVRLSGIETTRDEVLAAINAQVAGIGVTAALTADGLEFSAATPGAGSISVADANAAKQRMGFGGYVVTAGTAPVVVPPESVPDGEAAPVGDAPAGRAAGSGGEGLFGDLAGAHEVIRAIDAAIAAVSAHRATVGAVDNALTRRHGYLAVSGENLNAAYSRIRDTDVAAELLKASVAQLIARGAAEHIAHAQKLPNSLMTLLR